MMIRFTAILFFLVFGLRAQENNFFTAQERAYLYHTVKKSPILEQNLGRYIQYSGKKILLPNGKINYDSTELIIINNPEQLLINSNEIAKSPKGLLAELANKMALWELNKLLLSKRKNDLKKDNLEKQYQSFEVLLTSFLPAEALKEKDDVRLPHPKIESFLDPSLTFDNKVALLTGMKFLTFELKKSTLDALNKSVNIWVKNRAFEIFKALGGRTEHFTNILTAAGDGSTTTGLFEEREKDERGRYNKGLPKAVGLFPYESELIKQTEKRKKNKVEIQPMRYTICDLETVGQLKETNIHIDVWGYNSEKQTTVVIEKGGFAYPLFGNTQTRFLSPDSSYSGKATYYSIIHAVGRDIAAINEMIYGKKGFDYWIKYHENKKLNKLLDIEKTEKLLSDLRGSYTIKTDKKGKAKDGGNKRKIKQEELLRKYNELASIKKKIKELEEKKEEALEVLTIRNNKLNLMQDLIGRNWMPFKEKDGLYLFADSTRFDLYTQEFTFPATAKPESFEVKLIAIPYSQNSNEADEVMLHVNVTDALPNYDARVQIMLNDIFESDQFSVQQNLLNTKDSVAVLQLFEALLNKKLDFNIIARGQGVGTWNGIKVVKDNLQAELQQYPLPEAKQDEQFKRLRFSEVYINLNRSITLEVNSFTDPVKSNLNQIPQDMLSKTANFELSKNEVLSALRTYYLLEKLRTELNVLAGNYLQRADAKKVIDRLNKRIYKTKISVGRTSFKMSEFEG